MNQWLGGGIEQAYGYAGYAAASQISSKERSILRSQYRTEVTIITEYIPFRYFTRTASKTLYGNQYNHGVLWGGTTQNQDSGGSKTQGSQ